MPNVGNFPARIFLKAQLYQPDFFVFQLYFAFNTNDSSTLKAGRDAAVEVLLPGDVHLANDILFRQQRNLNGNIQRFPVKRKRRCIIHLISTGGYIFYPVNNLLFGFKFHECSSVIFTQFAECWPHVPDQFGIVIIAFVINTGGAITKQFFLGK